MALKKILILINSLEPGGAERVVSLLVNHLKDDFEVHLALIHNKIAYSIPPDTKILDFKETLDIHHIKVFLKIPLMAYKLYKYCTKNGIDTSVSFLNRPNYINGMMKSAYGFKGKIIMCERSHQTTVLASNSWAFRKVSETLVKFSYKVADLILTNSKLSKEDLVKNFKVKKPVRVIYNPIDVEYILRLSKEEINISFDPSCFYFITVGGFRKEKNYGILLRAFSQLKEIPAKLIIIGEGALQEEYIELANSLNISGSLHFMGNETNPFKYMARADCFVLSSYAEGFPNVLLESLTLSLPIVSTDCKAGPREMLAPGTDIQRSVQQGIEIVEHGILVPVNDIDAMAMAMEKMYTDKSLRENLAANSLERARAFDVEKIKLLYQQVFS